MGTSSEQSSYRIPKSASEYSLADLIQKVKPTDEDFLKYIRDELLSSDIFPAARQEFFAPFLTSLRYFFAP